MRIGVIIGGTQEHWRGISRVTYTYLEKYLTEMGCKVVLIDSKFMRTEYYRLLNVDCVFIAQHDILVTKGYTQSFLDLENINYIGSGVESVNKLYNKSQLKKLLSYENIPTSKATRVYTGSYSIKKLSELTSSKAMLKIQTQTQQLWYGDNTIGGGESIDSAIQKIESTIKIHHTALLEPYSKDTVHFSCVGVNGSPLAIVQRLSSPGDFPYFYTPSHPLSLSEVKKIKQLTEYIIQMFHLEGIIQIDFQKNIFNGIIVENILTHPPIYPGSSFTVALEKTRTSTTVILEKLISQANCYCVI